MIEQLSKEDTNPSKFSPQHIKNLAKTIEQNRVTGQYLSTNANTGENASINLLRHQHTRISEKKYQKPNKGKCSQFNQQEQSPQPNKKSHSQWNDNDGSDDESNHNVQKEKKNSNQMIALDVVIIDTKKASDAQPVNTSAKFVQKWDISQKCVSSEMRSSSTYSAYR